MIGLIVSNFLGVLVGTFILTNTMIRIEWVLLIITICQIGQCLNSMPHT